MWNCFRNIMANLVTCGRIVFGLMMLCFPAFSPGFYACYFVAGMTDMVDGTIARRFGTVSEFGEQLDTLADIVFVAAAFYKLLPMLEIGTALWVWIGVIAGIKGINIISGLVVQKRFVAVHSPANKLAGAALFVLPLTIPVLDIQYSAVFVCLLVTFAAVQEGHMIRTGRLTMKEETMPLEGAKK